MPTGETALDEKESLKKRLELKERELAMVMEIDRIRDTALTPSAMLSELVNMLAEHFQTDMCLLCLVNRETGELELKAVNDRSMRIGPMGRRISRSLAEQVLNTDGIALWNGDKLLHELGLSDPAESPQLAAVPIVMGESDRLGALLLLRGQHFSTDEVALIATAEDLVDSAVIQAYTHYDLQLRNRELETIYRVDNIRDQNLPFEEMLNAVLVELRGAIQAEMGFIMLYNRAGQRLELRAATHDDLFRMSSHYDTVEKLANDALQKGSLIYDNDLGTELRSTMCIPLILRDEIIGVLGVTNAYGPRGFDGEDRRMLGAIASQMDTAIFESMEQRRLRQVLGRSVDQRVMERMLSNPSVDFLKGERSTLTVLFGDIRGSTRLAERTEPELLVGFVNDYLGRMTEVILSHEGTLDKFVGDEVMAIFGAPFPQPDHALRAARVGVAMQTAHQAVMEKWYRRGLESPAIGVGIATGEMIVGEMGCPRRTNYTVIGRAVNLGARICDVARPGEVLVSQATYEMIKEHLDASPIDNLQLKGLDQNVTVYHVNRILER